MGGSNPLQAGQSRSHSSLSAWTLEERMKRSIMQVVLAAFGLYSVSGQSAFRGNHQAVHISLEAGTGTSRMEEKIEDARWSEELAEKQAASDEKYRSLMAAMHG